MLVFWGLHLPQNSHEHPNNDQSDLDKATWPFLMSSSRFFMGNTKSQLVLTEFQPTVGALP